MLFSHPRKNLENFGFSDFEIYFLIFPIFSRNFGFSAENYWILYENICCGADRAKDWKFWPKISFFAPKKTKIFFYLNFLCFSQMLRCNGQFEKIRKNDSNSYICLKMNKTAFCKIKKKLYLCFGYIFFRNRVNLILHFT